MEERPDTRTRETITSTTNSPKRSTDRIGPYKILERIGEGGFGVVYKAEQTEPVRRRVALKVIKPGMDTRAVIARFESERQALALMNHPNVAKVFDGGSTDQGRPYFVMEYVQGVRITEHCDRYKLGIEDRLKLFVTICEAVQHAHQKGIIHRDIKPSNILVSVEDGKAVPKVIDFGIAKAISQPLTEQTLFTERGQLIGTPEYMSPEQAELTEQDIDTRSDVYSLGVLLYEILTGLQPYESASLRHAALEEIRRIIREVDPSKPSTKLESALTSSSEKVSTIVQNRGSDSRALFRQLRGDLDWITMKALEKDRTRRYETATALAEEIGRYLRNEPVTAGPPSSVYRLRKFVRRNRGGVAATVVVAITLLLGLVGTSIGFYRAEQRRQEVQAALLREADERRRADEQRELADRRADETVKVAQFQSEMLSEIDVQAMGRGIFDAFRGQLRSRLERQWVGEFPDRRARTESEIDAELAEFDTMASGLQTVDVARRVVNEYVLMPSAVAAEEEFPDQPSRLLNNGVMTGFLW